MSKDRLWTPQFMTMGGGNFFYFLSQYLLVAAMPLYILEELHGNERDAGLAMTYFQLGTVLCRPFAGKIIDSLNKHRLLVAGSCAFLLIMTAFFFLRTLPAVFGLRFLHGAIFGVTSTAAAAVAALVLPLSRKGGRHRLLCPFNQSCHGCRPPRWTSSHAVLGTIRGLFLFDPRGSLYADCYDLQRAAVLCDPSQCLLPLFFSNRSH